MLLTSLVWSWRIWLWVGWREGPDCFLTSEPCLLLFPQHIPYQLFYLFFLFRLLDVIPSPLYSVQVFSGFNFILPVLASVSLTVDRCWFFKMPKCRKMCYHGNTWWIYASYSQYCCVTVLPASGFLLFFNLSFGNGWTVSQRKAFSLVPLLPFFL